MCGIAGIISLADKPVPVGRIEPACDSIAHRGPDDAGYAFFGEKWAKSFTDKDFALCNPHMDVFGRDPQVAKEMTGCLLALGHRRLSIIDLSSHGHQPMSTSDGRYWISYNGELYNFKELKRRVRGKYRFRSSSDTEVILALWAECGPAVLKLFNGIFAFAIYDRKENRLWLARDRFGVKPLYYAETAKHLVFASETKGILATGMLNAEISPENLYEYFSFQNILDDGTLFRGVKLLPPGTIAEIKPGSREFRISEYCRNNFEALPRRGEDAASITSTLFGEAVARQLVSDVEVGAYLSGGMDSGSIVSVAGRKLKRMFTFTCGFDLTNVDGIEQGFDERKNAEKLSYLLQTEHYDVVLHAGDMPAAMERLTWHMDDPRVGMCHQNWYAAKLASRFVKVCLSGTGGDELFGGYPWRYARFLKQKYDDLDSSLFSYWHRLLPEVELPGIFSPDLTRFSAKAKESFTGLMRGAPDYLEDLTEQENILQKILFFEFNSFLRGLLITEDRISMAHSLEARVPFLDNSLASLAINLSPSLKVDLEKSARNGYFNYTAKEGKLILRKAMEKFLPVEFTRQHKQGFSPPDENWFRGPSTDYIKDILLSKRTLSRPWFDKKQIKTRLQEHFSGKKNHRLLIWSLLSFEWLQRHYVD